MEKKKLKMYLPADASIIQRIGSHEVVVEFDEDALKRGDLNGFISDLFDQFLVVEPRDSKYFVPKMVRVLEEKFGIKIKICGNCKSYSRENQSCAYLTVPDCFVNFGDMCRSKSGAKWEPKEEIVLARSGHRRMI